MFMYDSTICLNLYRGIEQGHDFSLIVYDVFTLNSLDVEYVLSDILWNIRFTYDIGYVPCDIKPLLLNSAISSTNG